MLFSEMLSVRHKALYLSKFQIPIIFLMTVDNQNGESAVGANLVFALSRR